MPTTALKLTPKTILTIAEATGMTAADVNSVYETYCSLDQSGYVVLDLMCTNGCAHEPVSVDEGTFNRDFMFVDSPSDTEFREVLNIR